MTARRAPWFEPLDEDEVGRALAWAAARVEHSHHRRCHVNSGGECDCYFRSGSYQAARLVVAIQAANNQPAPRP